MASMCTTIVNLDAENNNLRKKVNTLEEQVETYQTLVKTIAKQKLIELRTMEVCLDNIDSLNMDFSNMIDEFATNVI